MDRYIPDAQSAEVEPHYLGKVADLERSGIHNRLFLEAELWIARTGSPWRHIPKDLCPWQTVSNCFNR